ncbi:MAG: RluA family pseudouridine synthase [Thermoanaerobaculia bacterium]|nr:RluA family pseudouridine synthase [Thermoanaerobaculia bacterium]
MISFVVGSESAGERLDRALAILVPDRSRSSLARLVSEGRVSIGGTVVDKSSHTVCAGDSIVLEIPDPAPSGTPAQDLPLRIVYQDADIVVVDKPAGLVVHPAAGHADSTLVNALLHHVRDLSGVGGQTRPGIVHRLDKDTSGLLVVAKNDAAHRALSSAWATPKVVKQYLALVYGTPRLQSGSIDKPIGRDPRDRKRMAVVASGRAALTDWELLERFSNTSLLRCTLRTGRTHQIRVHLKSIGHPVVGDPVYSGPQWRGVTDPRIRKALAALGRQALHATRLAFPHPRSGEPLDFESPLPEDMATAIGVLRGSA